MTEEVPIVNRESDSPSLEERLKNLRDFFFGLYRVEKQEEHPELAHFSDPKAPPFFDETDLGEIELGLWGIFLGVEILGVRKKNQCLK